MSQNAAHERRLDIYAELAIRIGLNLRAGQRLLIIGPLANGGASLDAAALIRRLVVSAYKAGAEYVETLWGDEPSMLLRFAHAPRSSFSQYSTWLPDVLLKHVEAGHATLSVYANDPDLLKNEPTDLVGAVQQAVSRAVVPFRERISRNHTNWAVIAAAAPGWAARVFPDLPPDQQLARLWDEIARMCRLDQPDPLASWETHLQTLAARRDYLNARQYSALKYTGPGTDLLLGLPEGHVWVSGRTESQNGIPFTANLPTEEVFTMAHKDRVDGTVRSTKPLSYAGTLIENFSVTFASGRVVEYRAARGQAVLKQLVETDEGAARLGEVALVPHSSPVSQSGLLYYNTLFDENAASHVALGSAYRFTLRGGEAMSDDAFARAGGNRSATHVDFMIGSGELDVDGVRADGTAEPLMRRGEWAIPATPR
jgi:aminopeptidase